MGSRKHLKAQQVKEERKSLCIARLRNCPTSPRKMRVVADNIRGVEVFRALSILQNSPQVASKKLEILLRSAIANWEVKNEGERADESALVVKSVCVDSGRMLKRIQPAPQGRAHRIRKRSNHVTLTIDSVK